MKSCRASAYRKFIVRLPGQPENERCSSPAYIDCPEAKQHTEERPSVDHCPFLHESLVQYCAAASVPKYIPYSESEQSQCSTESHAYCRLYAELSHAPASDGAEPDRGAHPPAPERLRELLVDGIAVPGWLWFSRNHMWLDAGEDGTYHVGVDAFLAKVLGAVDSLTFLTLTGLQRPAAVLSVRGVDLHLAFPAEISIRKANTYLRANPSKILTDPFGSGWLFEGRKARPASSERIPAGLMAGSDAGAWMRRDVEDMTRSAREASERPNALGHACMTDGGAFQEGLFQHLERDEILHLWNRFFSPSAAAGKVAP